MREERPKRVRGTPRVVQEAAKRLRDDGTRAEALMWEHLRGRRLGGLKFRRQQPMGPFILDFYCAETRLAVEIDGGIHDEQADRDQARSAVLKAHGMRVIRFTNRDVFGDTPGVLARILDASNPPLPELGEGGGEPRRAGG